MDSRFFALNSPVQMGCTECHGMGCEKCEYGKKRKKAKVISIIDKNSLPLQNPNGTLAMFQRGPVF